MEGDVLDVVFAGSLEVAFDKRERFKQELRSQHGLPHGVQQARFMAKEGMYVRDVFVRPP